MSLLFNDFKSWEKHCAETGEALYQPVLAYEIEQKGRTEEFIWENIARAFEVMKDAVQTGLTENMQSRSGMVNNSAKKVANTPVTVLSPEFQMLVSRALGAKEANSCTVPQRAVAPDFQQHAEELPVEGRSFLKPNGNFQIGNYTVANVHRGWRNIGGFSIFSYNNIRAKQQYEFSLQDGKGSEWYVFGASRLKDKSLRSNTGVTIDVGPNLEYYASHFTSPESGQWHLLTVDPGQYLERKKFEGELSNRSTTYTIAQYISLREKGCRGLM